MTLGSAEELEDYCRGYANAARDFEAIDEGHLESLRPREMTFPNPNDGATCGWRGSARIALEE